MLASFPERFSYAINLIKVRTRKTKKQIAEEINISPAALTQLTKGVSKQASESTLYSLNKKYSLNPTWLLDGVGDIFTTEDGFESLREDITVGTCEYGEKYVVATSVGWAKILNYYYSEIKSNSRLTIELAKKINSWPGVANSLRPIHGTPIFLRNYKSATDDNNNTSIYTLIMFHLEGTPPKGYMVTTHTNSIPRTISCEVENRVLLSCEHLFDVNWNPIKCVDDYEYFVDLSHKEYLKIINTQPPKDILALKGVNRG